MKLRISLPGLLFFFLLSTCGGPTPNGSKSQLQNAPAAGTPLDTITVVNAQGEREEFFQSRLSGKKEGWYRRWSPGGQKREEAFFSEGQPDVIRILYFEQGDTQIVESYKKGNFEGPYRLYYPNGNIQLKGAYRNNQMDGIWAKYDENGSLMEEVTFANNLENGPFREYYPNGNLKVEGAYRNGDKEHGLLKFYDETGKHIKTMDCEDGLCRTVWLAPQ